MAAVSAVAAPAQHGRGIQRCVMAMNGRGVCAYGRLQPTHRRLPCRLRTGERVTAVLDFPRATGVVNAVRVDYAPGGFTRGTHRHPAGAYVYVIDGSVMFGSTTASRSAKGRRVVLRAAGALHSVSRNASETLPASMIAFFVSARAVRDGLRP